MSINKRLLICVLIASHLCACASTPSYPTLSEAQRSRIGKTVGVVAPTSAKNGVFVGPTGSGKDVAMGAGKGAAEGASAVMMHGCTGVGCIVNIILLPVFIVGGTVVGAVQALPGNRGKAVELEAQLRKVMAEADPQAALRFSVVDVAARVSVHNVTEIISNIPTEAWNSADYRKQLDAKVETILEVGLVSVSFIEGVGTDPLLVFHADAIARLVDARTKEEFYRHSFTYNSSPRRFDEWNADGAHLIEEGFESAYRSLGQSIVREILWP